MSIRRSFHLLVPSSISLFNILKLLLYKYFTSLDLLKHFFKVFKNGIVFLSWYVCCLYKEKLLILCVNLYMATLLNVFISCGSFLLESWGFSLYGTTSPANKDSLTSSFPPYILFTSFICLIALMKTWSTIFDRSGENPSLIPNFSGNALSFSPLKMMFAVGLLWICFILLYVPHIHSFFQTFFVKVYHTLLKTLSATNMLCDFYPWVYLYDGLHLFFIYDKPSLHHLDEASLFMVDNLFYVFLTWVCKYFIEFASILFYFIYFTSMFILYTGLKFVVVVESLCVIDIKVILAL